MDFIKIGFSTSNSWLSWLVRKIQKTPYSHTYVVLDYKEPEPDFIYHADERGVNCQPYKNFIQKNKIIKEFSFNVNETQKQEIKDLIDNSLGKPYSYLQLVGILLIKFCRLFKRTIKNPFANNNQSYICVEVVGKILFILGHNIDFKNIEDKDLKWIYNFINNI